MKSFVSEKRYILEFILFDWEGERKFNPNSSDYKKKTTIYTITYAHTYHTYVTHASGHRHMYIQEIFI